MPMQRLYAALRETSRTFALSIEQLPQPLRDGLTVGYLLLRVSDAMEDHEALEPGRKADLLELWDRVLAGDEEVTALTGELSPLAPADAELRVAQEADMVLEGLAGLPAEMREAVRARVRETTRGMARWQRRGPYVPDEAALDDYMHQVAGLVGYLITDLFAAHAAGVRRRRGELMPLAREFGLALQTVNVVRGVRKDFERGWIYVPESFAAAEGLSREELFEAERRLAALAVMRRLLGKGERHLENGLRYIELLPRRYHRLRLMCIWPLCFAARTLAVSRDNPAVLETEAKISRGEVRSIMRWTRLLGWSNRWLRWYYARQVGQTPSASSR
jgi:farnesyl-diphosphate farnesyltransferase